MKAITQTKYVHEILKDRPGFYIKIKGRIWVAIANDLIHTAPPEYPIVDYETDEGCFGFMRLSHYKEWMRKYPPTTGETYG